MAIAILLEMLQALVARTREVTLEKTGTERTSGSVMKQGTAPDRVYSLCRALTFWGYRCKGSRNLSQTTFFDELNELVFSSIFRS